MAFRERRQAIVADGIMELAGPVSTEDGHIG
jgi:hypothetical protein